MIHYVARKNLSYKKIASQEDNIYARRGRCEMKADAGNAGGGKISLLRSQKKIPACRIEKNTSRNA